MKYRLENEKIRKDGRVLFRDNTCFLGYSGTAVRFRFFGKKAGARIVSDVEGWEEQTKAWVAVYLDEEKEPYKRFPLEKGEAEYILYEEPEEKEVTVTLMKYSEAEYAKCGVQEIFTDAPELLEIPEQSERRMLMIGDSITCGYGVEGEVEELEFTTDTENPMKSYSLLTARALNAQAQLVAWNGKGVITSYVGEEVNVPDASWLVPMLYEYTDAGCERDYFKLPKEKWEKWNHEAFQADLVTVNLGTNDASYTRNIPEREEEFCQAYVRFLERIHETQPKAAILCMLGTMDQRLCASVQRAVEEFAKQYDKVQIRYLELPMQLEEDGLGTFWHPTAVTQKKTAELVVKEIRTMMNWQ